MTDQFSRAFKEINQEFGRIMQLMFQGGRARLELTDEAHPLEGGVEMYLQLPGKKRLKTDELLRGFKLTEDYKVR